jgi:hypothetical protein
MKSVRIASCIVLIVLAGFYSPAFSMVKEMSLSEIVHESDVIVKGTVVATEAKWITDQRGSHIYTLVTLAPETTVKGAVPGKQLTVEVPGGTVGDVTESVSFSASFDKGEQVVLFLKSGNIVGGFQGKFTVYDGKVYSGNNEIPVEGFLQGVQGAVLNPGKSIAFPASPGLEVRGSGQVPASEVPAVTKTVEQPEAKPGGEGVSVVRFGDVLANEIPVLNEPAEEPGGEAEGPPLVVLGGGDVPAALVPGRKATAAEASSGGENSELTVIGEGQAAVGESPQIAAEVSNPPQPLVLTTTISSTSWTNQIDLDGNGFKRSARLYWDPNVVGGAGSLVVFERLYYKSSYGTTWMALAQIGNHTITGVSKADMRYVDITMRTAGVYDFRIEIYRSGMTSPDYVRSYLNDPHLLHCRLEPASLDKPPRAALADVWWSNQVDADGDGYRRSARLNWNVDTVPNVGSAVVYEVIYYRVWNSAHNNPWTWLISILPHTVRGNSTADAKYIDIFARVRAAYDFRIDVYRQLHPYPDDSRQSANDPDLSMYRMEPASMDKPAHLAATVLKATIRDAWWTNQVDIDGDGYKRSARLNWDADVVGGGGSLVVFERLYYKPSNVNTWTFLLQMPLHTITGVSAADAKFFDIVPNYRNLYDFRIDVYRNFQTAPDYSRNPTTDLDLKNYKMEPAAQDVLILATIYDAWWTNKVNLDGDTFVRSARLNWDPDVVGAVGTLSVFEKVYYKVWTATTWTYLTQTTAHTITGNTAADSQFIDIYATTSANSYDFKIEVYRSGTTAPDSTRTETNDPDLNNFKMEMPSQDGGGPSPPTIAGIAPNKASAGTNTQVTITGSNFGATRGTGKVEFFYRAGQPKIAATIISWSNAQIRCTVPIATVAGYPASAGSGLVTVTTSAGTSYGYLFRVTFGYGQLRWAGIAPLVRYRVNPNTTDCIGEATAVQTAAFTWNAVNSKFQFQYAGAHTNTTANRNFSNEVMWTVIPIPGVIAAAYTWSSGGIISECDIVFNDNFTWSTAATPAATAMDVQTIAVHELGHWLSLRDLYGNVGDTQYDIAKVMYGFGSTGLVKRVLHADDRAGILWIYGPIVGP